MSFEVIILYTMFGLASGAGVLPDSVNAAVGDTVMFPTSLTPTQTPFISIVWNFGKTNIISSSSAGNFTAPEYEGRISLFISTGSLELRNMALSDTGDYKVDILPAGSAVQNGDTTLNVYERITNIYVESSSNEPIEGSSLNLTCDASGSIFTRKWSINEQELNPSENIIFYDQKRVLSFKILSRKDSGRYLCEISNPISSETTAYNLDVIFPSEGLSAGAIAGITVAVLVVVAGAAVGGFYLYKHLQKVKQ
ncbi:hypothetical protein NL108_000172 [Boleophthalmus pectinirostris]|uniref:carcinoembryonic antigen-related cell adhesion molecule 1-like n=1 Tax=Boleophthalmus pectinirostris TaxID=150288 RepID=UPI00242D1656|nr:carcinoembryonic antigen-related cell adhesion molecule 1-like [Boleophthalmus pectinirostris]XP_055020261.1 carcinoembryonic antigen-related cell adhesion molecule 1-like [Boleophthalmus pectinirostris]KAJ0065923.1 hypothetical protein NL108_000172 [Boleophthalmus pectinirostris]